MGTEFVFAQDLWRGIVGGPALPFPSLPFPFLLCVWRYHPLPGISGALWQSKTPLWERRKKEQKKEVDELRTSSFQGVVVHPRRLVMGWAAMETGVRYWRLPSSGRIFGLE
jgi:hypothetical protein